VLAKLRCSLLMFALNTRDIVKSNFCHRLNI
jgi:hypothetical protein